MASDLIRYDLLVQDALRAVVRNVLQDAAKDGLRGDHHFYITFRTSAPGVRLSERMRTRYPDDMMIILQHQFWDLAVTDQGFEVGLSFGGVPERLSVPFKALVAFSDPAAEFGLKFEVHLPVEAGTDKPAGTVTKLGAVAAPKLAASEDQAAKQPSPAAKPKQAVAQKQSDDEKSAPRASKSTAKSGTKVTDQAEQAGDNAKQVGKDAKIVSIDAFRKK